MSWLDASELVAVMKIAEGAAYHFADSVAKHLILSEAYIDVTTQHSINDQHAVLEGNNARHGSGTAAQD